MHPITGYVHHHVAERVRAFAPQSVLDVGGVGKMAQFLEVPVRDVNITGGVDGTALPLPDKSFDVAISVATLEHVSDQMRFIGESMRVARKGVAHWFPFGEPARTTERYKDEVSRRCGRTYVHDCSVPAGDFARAVEHLGGKCSWHPLVTVSEHMLLLSSLYEQFNDSETYDFAKQHQGEPYGTILVIDLRPSQ